MSRKRGHAAHEAHMDESWLIPYADLMTLLLALFIVLFASSNVDKEKFQALSQAFYSEFGGSGVLPGIGTGVTSFPPTLLPVSPSHPSPSPSGPPSGEGEDEELRSLMALQGELEQYFDEAGLGASVDLHIDERGLVISLRDSVLFDSGSADIKSDQVDTLIKTGGIINKLDNYIRVEGHTDNQPIVHSAKFESNWELSAMRATTVIKLFISSANIVPGKLVAVAYGENKPIADNATAEGRAQNRRVNIIILSSKYNSLEEDFEPQQKNS